jgi:hypothetical protein
MRLGGMNTPTRRLLVVFGAAAANVALWALAVPAAGVDLSVQQPGSVMTVGPVIVAVATLVAGFAAWGLLALLERFTRRAGLVWSIIAAAVLLVSVAGPLGATSTAAVLVLVGMHAVAAAVLIPGLVRR